MVQVQVKELMNAMPMTLSPDAPLSQVTAIMSERRFSCMIIAVGETPVGIVTERDLVKYLDRIFGQSEESRAGMTAGDVMSCPPVTIEEDACMFDALVLTQARKIRHLPVVDKVGHVSGILTYTDLAHAHNHIIELQSEIIDKAVAEHTSDLQLANQELKALSMEDPLLEIGNRRAMEVDLSYTHSSAIRYERPYSVVLYDIDSFKLYNDHYGHQAGDEALKQVADHLKQSVRSADRLYRYGGEEILLLLPETDMEGAQVLASRTVRELEVLQIPHAKSTHQVLTMSGGIGSPCNFGDTDLENWDLIVKQADSGLYEAKNRGRNQVFSMS
jgi:diguanylate cyclase (GGDEF)-like protein